ncbi:MAG: S41 family peptidase [Planctomycetota bacterium]
MMSVRWFVPLLVISTLLVPPGTAADDVIPADKAQRKKDALAVMADLERLYVFFDVKGIRKDWEGRKKGWTKQAASLGSDEELVALIQDMIDSLRDGHMGFRELNIKAPPRDERYFSGIYFGETQDGRVCVVNDASGFYPGAKPGTEVVKVDGKSARKWLDERARELWECGGAFSSPQRAEMLVWRWGLRGAQNESHDVVLKDGRSQREFTARNSYRCSMIPETLPKVPDLVESPKSRDVRYRELEPGIGYIYVRGVSPETDAAVAEAAATMKKVKGLVIDISDNGGGGGYSVQGLAPFKGKIAVLVSPRCFSAGETYARDLVNGCGARLFGTQTAGSSSAKDDYKLPRNLGTITYSTRSRNGVKGPIEFHGIEPHENVLYDPKDLAAGESTLVKAAVAWLKAKALK